VPVGDTQLPPGVTLSADQQQRLTELIQAERSRAALWEYRYLNCFLVPATQRVLDWLAGLNQRTSVSMFDSLWSAVIPNPQERVAIIAALENHHLI